MAERSDGGVAADLVRQASTRIQGIAGWIGDRDPGSLLTEVKSYARAKPGTFIAVAALAGLVAGRLTRALSEGAAESASAGSGPAGSGSSSAAGATAAAVPPRPVVPAATTPGAVPGGAGAAGVAGGAESPRTPPSVSRRCRPMARSPERRTG